MGKIWLEQQSARGFDLSMWQTTKASKPAGSDVSDRTSEIRRIEDLQAALAQLAEIGLI
jgi:hypothetical protein